MANRTVNRSTRLTPSIMDRLSGNLLAKQADSRNDQTFSVHDMKQSVRKDLEKLLNSRISHFELDSSFSHSNNSILNYGLPELSTVNILDEESTAELCTNLTQTINRYEPRLREVKVNAIGPIDETDRMIRFKIVAILLLSPETEPVEFQSFLEPISKTIRLEG